MDYDFSGYATKNDLLCSDGRIIRHNAFVKNHKKKVPLVWQHQHNSPINILGHALLENRNDGVYAYASLNDTEQGDVARELIKHGDVNSLSIYANELVQNGSDVVHGNIREVSLVLSGANPGALIDTVAFAHADGSPETEAIIYTGLELKHSDEEKEPEMAEETNSSEESVQDIYDSMDEKQKQVVHFLVGEALAGAEDEDDDDYDEEMQQSAIGGDYMSRNVFEPEESSVDVLSHAEFSGIVEDAKRLGSMREAFLVHGQEYGIENIDVLFPDARTITPTPELVTQPMDWVPVVLHGTSHSPFARIKSTAADITADEARAKGYVKGNRKKEEVFKVMKRVTTPTTVYKKQKLDRDDIVDITDLDVVAFMKSEMRLKLDEELARALLVGDGRDAESEDKIDEEHLRPIWTDDEFYTIRETAPKGTKPEELVDMVIRARKKYRGTGTPTLFANPETLTDLLLVKDTLGHRLYKTEAELAAALRVSNIVEVPLMEGLKRKVGEDGETASIDFIIVNLQDYRIGADKGGEVNMFDDFDIDYNQYKYLIETRISGALFRPRSAIVIERSSKAADE